MAADDVSDGVLEGDGLSLGLAESLGLGSPVLLGSCDLLGSPVSLGDAEGWADKADRQISLASLTAAVAEDKASVNDC